MATEEKIPIYLFELDDSGSLKYGIQAIALVDHPAYKTDFFKFDEKKEAFKFEVTDQEKRIVTGPLMIPDQLVYRTDEQGKPFYVGATSDVIYQAAQKFSQEGRNNLIKATHDDAPAVDGVFVFESFIKDPTRVQNVKGFETLPDGTWFITCKINNDQVWNQIKDGTFKGFSLEAFFKAKQVTSLSEADIKAMLEAIE